MIDVTAIKLPAEFEGYKNVIEEKSDFLEPLSKINIFVGANNSGKSRLMRELASQESYEVKVLGVDLEIQNELILQAITKIKNAMTNFTLTKLNGMTFSDFDMIESAISNTLNSQKDIYEQIRKDLQHWSQYKSVEDFERLPNRYESIDPIISIFQTKSQDALDSLKTIPIFTETDNPKKVYIPTLRGLRHLNPKEDVYESKTIDDYFKKDSKETNFDTKCCPTIFTGRTLYQRITDMLLGNNSERKSIQQYQEFISEKLFEGKPTALIPSPKEKTLVVKIGNEAEQPIHKLGDGIQSAIILTFLPFITEKQTFFFIEEPEMFLHPGLQRKILNFYKDLKQHTFFMTTHSNHFLDITIDIKDVSIFTFRKDLDESIDESKPSFTFEAVDSGCESSLELLGVRNSSVFLVNATVWVEGITDRWYFRTMLESYMETIGAKEFRAEEDTHYSFVEYGGSNITHWSFLDKEEKPIGVENLCAKAMVIVDGDGDSKMERKEELKKVLGNRLIILPCREVENLLPYDVIKQVVAEYEKDENIKFPSFKYDTFKDQYLGKFIENRMLNKNIKRKGKYQAGSGTLKSKTDFCERAKDKIKFNELPDSTKKVVKQIYEFIREQNS